MKSKVAKSRRSPARPCSAISNKQAIQIVDILMDAYESIQVDISYGEKRAQWDTENGDNLSAEGWKLRALGSKDALSHFRNALMEIRHDILPNVASEGQPGKEDRHAD